MAHKINKCMVKFTLIDLKYYLMKLYRTVKKDNVIYS